MNFRKNIYLVLTMKKFGIYLYKGLN